MKTKSKSGKMSRDLETKKFKRTCCPYVELEAVAGNHFTYKRDEGVALLCCDCPPLCFPDTTNASTTSESAKNRPCRTRMYTVVTFVTHVLMSHHHFLYDSSIFLHIFPLLPTFNQRFNSAPCLEFLFRGCHIKTSPSSYPLAFFFLSSFPPLCLPRPPLSPPAFILITYSSFPFHLHSHSPAVVCHLLTFVL